MLQSQTLFKKTYKLNRDSILHLCVEMVAQIYNKYYSSTRSEALRPRTAEF